MKRVFRDEIAQVCYDMMNDLYQSGIVPDSEMHTFEKNCFVSVPGTAAFESPAPNYAAGPV